MQSSLFPQQGAAGTGASRALIEFKAGKCSIGAQPTSSGKYLVTPDTEKRGKITLSKSPDGLISFKWSNILNGVAEDDRIVFPGEIVFKSVNTGREGDRVFMLKYLSGNQQLMYWMQDKSAEKDEYNCKRLNDLMTNPNAADSGAQAASASSGDSADTGGNVVSPENWMNMMGLGAQPAQAGAAAAGGLDFFNVLNRAQTGSSGAPTAGLPVPPSSSSTPASASASASVSAPAPSSTPAPTSAHARQVLTLADLQRAMQQTAAPKPTTPPLQDILLGEDIINSGVLTDAVVQQQLLEHLPYNPEGEQTIADLESTVRSPQFRQALNSLTHAVAQSDNYQSVMSNFNIDPAPGIAQQMAGDGVGAFLAALSAANPPSATSSSSSSSSSLSSSSSSSSEAMSTKMEEEEASEETPLMPPPPPDSSDGDTKK